MTDTKHQSRPEPAPYATVEQHGADNGLLSPRTALILAGAGTEVWLACTDPMAGGAVAGGVGVAYLLHRLLRRH